MSVIMMLRLNADPDALERYAQENPEQSSTRDHRGREEQGRDPPLFFAVDGDEVIAIDEWPDEESFQGFFEGQQDIPKVMQAAGAQGEPEVEFYRGCSRRATSSRRPQRSRPASPRGRGAAP